ncbi:MAG: hypothetical protein ACRDKJ_12170 [Actinomycetota bacterium]
MRHDGVLVVAIARGLTSGARPAKYALAPMTFAATRKMAATRDARRRTKEGVST